MFGSGGKIGRNDGYGYDSASIRTDVNINENFPIRFRYSIYG